MPVYWTVVDFLYYEAALFTGSAGNEEHDNVLMPIIPKFLIMFPFTILGKV